MIVHDIECEAPARQFGAHRENKFHGDRLDRKDDHAPGDAAPDATSPTHRSSIQAVVWQTKQGLSCKQGYDYVELPNGT